MDECQHLAAVNLEKLILLQWYNQKVIAIYSYYGVPLCYWITVLNTLRCSYSLLGVTLYLELLFTCSYSLLVVTLYL